MQMIGLQRMIAHYERGGEIEIGAAARAKLSQGAKARPNGGKCQRQKVTWVTALRGHLGGRSSSANVQARGSVDPSSTPESVILGRKASSECEQKAEQEQINRSCRATPPTYSRASACRCW